MALSAKGWMDGAWKTGDGKQRSGSARPWLGPEPFTTNLSVVMGVHGCVGEGRGRRNTSFGNTYRTLPVGKAISNTGDLVN
jgi:hypothetical protein